MAIHVVRAAAELARSAIRCRANGLWQVIRAYIEGRNALSFERERRTTLLTVPPRLPPGSELYDLRADGSVLEMRVPPRSRIDVVLGGNIDQSMTPIDLPAVTASGPDTRCGGARRVPAEEE